MKTEIQLLGQQIDIASRTRRRWLVVLIYAGFAALIAAWFALYSSPTAAMRSITGLAIFFAIQFMGRFLGGRTYRDGIVPPAESGDEREQHRRDHAYYLAYKWWDLTFIPVVLSVGLKINVDYSTWQPALRIFFDRLPWGLAVAAGILYFTLPQAILLWTEPDMEEEQVL
jgi:hypothetical protein